MDYKESGEVTEQMKDREPLLYLDIKVDYQNSHIQIKEPQVCINNCRDKNCTYICPSFVYEFKEGELEVFYQRCVECGACKLTCPNNNINLFYPAGGYGVVWKY